MISLSRSLLVKSAIVSRSRKLDSALPPPSLPGQIIVPLFRLGVRLTDDNRDNHLLLDGLNDLVNVAGSARRNVFRWYLRWRRFSQVDAIVPGVRRAERRCGAEWEMVEVKGLNEKRESAKGASRSAPRCCASRPRGRAVLVACRDRTAEETSSRRRRQTDGGICS